MQDKITTAGNAAGADCRVAIVAPERYHDPAVPVTRHENPCAVREGLDVPPSC